MTTDSDFIETIAAIRGGDIARLDGLLANNPGLAASRLGGIAGGRTPLHIVCDWPGYFPNGPRVASMLIEAGADLNDRGADDGHGETPLHWTASSDDADVAAVLIDAGADLEALNWQPDYANGTPLDAAGGHGTRQDNVIEWLTNRGARSSEAPG